jgi:hypothetical protein
MPYVPEPGMMTTDVALYASFKVEFKFFMISQNGFDMWFMERSVYTTEYSKSPPAASNGKGLAWNGFDQSCWHLGSFDFASSCLPLDCATTLLSFANDKGVVLVDVAGAMPLLLVEATLAFLESGRKARLVA